MPNSRFISLRTAFFAGLLLLAPLAITWVVFSKIVELVGGSFRPLFFIYLPVLLRDHQSLVLLLDVLVTLIVVCLITALGYLSRYVFGKFFGAMTERFIQSIPGVGTVYNMVKQVVDAFIAQNRNLFSKVVVVEFPRKGSWAIGFLTGESRGELASRLHAGFASVFIPTTPNPTSGFLIYVQQSEIVELDMSVGDGMKMIISGGTVIPPWPNGGPPAALAQNPPPSVITPA